MEPVVAMIYDFDGTLSPGNMQEFGFVQAFGTNAENFWKATNKEAIEQDANGILCYMKHMVDAAKQSGVFLTKKTFRCFGERIELYPGVQNWFSLVNSYAAKKGLKIEHYINSSGLKEMIEGTPIANEFKRIYACSFLYDISGSAVWPAVAVDYTTKTQFLFKINKGVESVNDNVEVNQYISEEERPVPFRRMIYFGDGETDIPCMKLVKVQGGYSVAVYKPCSRKQDMARKLIMDDRVNFVCTADYSEGGEIHTIVKTILDKMRSDYDFEQLQQRHKNKL